MIIKRILPMDFGLNGGFIQVEMPRTMPHTIFKENANLDYLDLRNKALREVKFLICPIPFQSWKDFISLFNFYRIAPVFCDVICNFL